MAKPIIVISVTDPKICKNAAELIEAVKKSVDYEYHAMILYNPYISNTEMNVYNDCKGLPDIDIEQLIKDHTNGTSN